MRRRALLMGLALGALGWGAWLLLHNDDPRDVSGGAPVETPDADDGSATLSARGTPPDAPPIEAPPTEGAFLAQWDVAQGIPMGSDDLTGVVVDVAGAPIPSARVWLRMKTAAHADLDKSWAWSFKARVDAAGTFVLKDTWASHSLLGAFAPGYELTFVEDLTKGRPLRVVLQRTPTLLVRVQPPKHSPQERVRVQGLQVAVRLIDEGGSEHPRPGQSMNTTWTLPVEVGASVPLHIDPAALGYVSAYAREFVSDPPFVRYLAASKEIVFQLVPSATIALCLIDAETKAPLDIGGGMLGQLGVTHQVTGYWPNTHQVVESRPGWRYFNSGIAQGTYDIQASRPPYRLQAPLEPIHITTPGQVVRLEIPMVRDVKRATVRVHVAYAESNQRAGSDVRRGGGLFLRPHKPKRSAWTQVWGMSERAGRGEVTLLTDVTPGTYDVLCWENGSFPSLSYRKGVEVQGGQENAVRLALKEGYGFRPTDVVASKPRRLMKLRVECPELGAVPWIDIDGHVHMQDDAGFTDTDGGGYIGKYPSASITLVELLPNGKQRRHALKASISPPGR